MRNALTLFSSVDDVLCHRVRLVLAAKGVTYDLIPVDPQNPPEDLIDLNPFHSVPTLVERDLVLYAASVVGEYLDERYPHPPLMPVDPVSRAQTRLMLHRLERDWYAAAAAIDAAGDPRDKAARRKELRETVLQSADLFKLKPYFLSTEFTMVDATLAPMLWRLPHWGIDLPAAQAQPIMRYAQLVFARPGFRASLSAVEQGMRGG